MNHSALVEYKLDVVPHTFIIGPRVAIGPFHKLLVDPRKQSDWRVGERVAQRLRTRGLFLRITRTPVLEPLRPGKTVTLVAGVWG